MDLFLTYSLGLIKGHPHTHLLTPHTFSSIFSNFHLTLPSLPFFSHPPNFPSTFKTLTLELSTHFPAHAQSLTLKTFHALSTPTPPRTFHALSTHFTRTFHALYTTPQLCKAHTQALSTCPLPPIFFVPISKPFPVPHPQPFNPLPILKTILNTILAMLYLSYPRRIQ